MDSFELNKIIGAILGTLLFVMGVGFLAEGIYAPIADRGPGLSLPVPEGEASAGGEAEQPVAVADIGRLLASANVEQGAIVSKKCAACHNFEQGAGNKQGPELYGVVGRVMGSHEGFTYSEAMKAHQAAGDTWTYENLNHFLTSPKGFIDGTKMNFPGIKADGDRANLIAYLASISPDAPPFPAPAPAEGAEPAADAAAPAADGAAPAADAAAPAADAAPATDAAPAADAAAPAADAGTVATPTTTSTETPVEGTPTTSAPGDAATPATPGDAAAPAADATTAPATTTSP